MCATISMNDSLAENLSEVLFDASLSRTYESSHKLYPVIDDKTGQIKNFSIPKDPDISLEHRSQIVASVIRLAVDIRRDISNSEIRKTLSSELLLFVNLTYDELTYIPPIPPKPILPKIIYSKPSLSKAGSSKPTSLKSCFRTLVSLPKKEFKQVHYEGGTSVCYDTSTGEIFKSSIVSSPVKDPLERDFSVPLISFEQLSTASYLNENLISYAFEIPANKKLLKILRKKGIISSSISTKALFGITGIFHSALNKMMFQLQANEVTIKSVFKEFKREFSKEMRKYFLRPENPADPEELDTLILSLKFTIEEADKFRPLLNELFTKITLNNFFSQITLPISS